MSIASRKSTVCSAALLTFLLGSATACAADVSERQIVLSYAAGGSVKLSASYPDYGSEPGFAARSLVRTVGALAVGLERIGTTDDKVAAAALLGRAFLLNGDHMRARRRLDAALESAAAAGWDDRRANGILRDLAWLTEANGDRGASSEFVRRAEACPKPCALDALPHFQEEASAASDAVYKALGPDLGVARIEMAKGEDLILFAEETYGPGSEELISAWRARAVRGRDSRPWQALDYYQRLLDLSLTAGRDSVDILDTRRAIADLLLRAGEHRRLAAFAAALVTEALQAARGQPEILSLPGIAMDAARLRARALWHLGDPAARDAYGVAMETMFEFGNVDMARLLLRDLLDGRYDDEAIRVAEGLLMGFPGDSEALFAKARVSAWAENFDEAAALVAEIPEQTSIAILQRAFYLEKAGRQAEATALRADVILQSPEEASSWDPWSELSEMLEPRDAGAYEGAAAAARSYLGMAERMITAGSYGDAQRLWQIAYTLARGGETAESFRLMTAAASIAARLSFADANDTDGGSLQLLRRDKFRYLLFVDIAWAAATGALPDTMIESPRY